MERNVGVNTTSAVFQITIEMPNVSIIGGHQAFACDIAQDKAMSQVSGDEEQGHGHR